MKKLILISFVFLSCSSNNLNQNEITTQDDSILMNSQKNLNFSDSIFKKTDSATTEKVTEVIREIQFLNKEVEKFKTERVLLETKLHTISQTVITRVDTIFIEVEKNFWGKKKVKTTISSDSSSVQEIIDSSNIIQKIDTLQIN